MSDKPYISHNIDMIGDNLHKRMLKEKSIKRSRLWREREERIEKLIMTINRGLLDQQFKTDMMRW